MSIRRHIAYAEYIARHKWFVLVAGLRVGAPLWRLIVHDWSKLTPTEWGPYARTFYAADGSKRYKPDLMFDAAWLHHQHHNPHHWQAWILRKDNGATKNLPMPEPVAREMVADWMGAGRAITGRWEVNAWYWKNRETIILHADTRRLVEQLVGPKPEQVKT